MMLYRDLKFGIIFTLTAGIIAHIFGLVFPKKLLKYNVFPFREYSYEAGGSFYNKFHISKWIAKAPDMSKVVPYMFKKKLNKEMSSEHIFKYIKETCLSELVHYLLILSSPVLLFTVRGRRGLIFMLIYIFCNIPFIMIQRYNRPKLVRLYHRQIKRENSKREKEALK
ncbi:MAG: hypothetical protein IKK94_07110 [Clostridia bacterium]|nr:hypothetical protein [Clostridia bacterium]